MRTSSGRKWLLQNVMPVLPVSMEQRRRALVALGVQVGAGTRVGPGCLVYGDVQIGDRAYVNAQCYLEGSVVVEDQVYLAPGVRLLGTTHEIAGPDQRAGDLRRAPVRVGRGSWIGAGAVVLPGVTVAPGCVIAAGAVVTRSTEPDGLYAGVPAARTRDL
ncbi:maltose O-acetyltransferase/hypothetical protein [Motilibacter rhizosphaerae]|uniref:Maltose O-acetyltransferase n=1 Tax=Motilibacter rhizosphaerae TaxID=598652 RepID=A0A4Q7NRS6_9ACTN|nr:DapH/DapD/GlmU-related protein [Motilibacter rhizosphaerae]RZS87350.1 maltose O-acetyltransferase/hypothetical protein [Motilibacter rhizosphaerae]